ncbi:MAG: zeta toxin family protein [Bacteroidales bacterium]|nr:zeta toxin family protein [Bacteroidales bacterium]
MPQMYILAGCNGSGKTTASYNSLPGIFDCSEFVNSDEFAKSLAPFNPESVPVQASRYMLLKSKYLFERRADFSIETTLATRSLIKMVRAAKAQGYFVTVFYMWLSSPEIAIARIKARVDAGGHYIPEETVKRRYYVGLKYFFNVYVPECDRWILADNSDPPFKIVAEGTKNAINIKEPALYEHIRAQEEAHREVYDKD